MEPRLDAPDDRLRVLVVDADRRVRQSLCWLLDLADGLEVVGAAADTASALSLLRDADAQLVVLDPRLPDFDAGLAALRAIRETAPHVPVIALAWPDEHPPPAEDGLVHVVPPSVQPEGLVELLRHAGGRAA